MAVRVPQSHARSAAAASAGEGAIGHGGVAASSRGETYRYSGRYRRAAGRAGTAAAADRAGWRRRVAAAVGEDADRRNPA